MSLPSLEGYFVQIIEDGQIIETEDRPDIICHLCANRMKPTKKYWDFFESPPDENIYVDWDIEDTKGLHFTCCDECEKKIDETIVDIFAEYPRMEDFGMDFIKKDLYTACLFIVNQMYEYNFDTGLSISINDKNNKTIFAHSLLRSTEYNTLCKILKSMSIWNTLEIKL